MNRQWIALFTISFLPSLACAADPHAESQTASTQTEPAQPELPAGHPEMTTSPVFELPPVAEDAGTGSTGLSWTVPEGWVEEQPANAMRKAQYRVPGEGGDAQCVVFYFGPGQGGSPLANAQRWGSQFIQPDGRSSLEVLKTAEIEVNGIPVLTCEISGTYGGGMTMGGQGTPAENQMLLGAVAEGPDANWFFKFTGPRATVEANRGKFEELLGSLRSGQ